jgi:hypothetical protein
MGKARDRTDNLYLNSYPTNELNPEVRALVFDESFQPRQRLVPLFRDDFEILL